MEAVLALADGTVLRGEGFGAQTERVGEVVFNTNMTGYQEVLTDPSYRGQMVAMTVPHVGNVGINPEDVESRRPQVEGFIVRALSPVVSNWRSAQSLPSYLAEHGIPGIAEVDTRALTRHLREGGVVKGCLSTLPDPDPEELIERARQWEGLDGRDLVREVSCRAIYAWKEGTPVAWQQKDDRRWTIDDGGQSGEGSDPPSRSGRWAEREGRLPSSIVCRPSSFCSTPHWHVVAYDFGIKRNILRQLVDLGCWVTVVPATTTAEETLALHPDGVVLSNGPGDPAALPYAVEAVAGLIEADLPVFGICLGHQLIGRALGGNTYKLKFGHHGGNQPVKDLITGTVQITAQNHNYAVDPATLNPNKVEITHWNLNDHTVEGLRLKEHPVFSVQYHPEASPGPHDADALFRQFVDSLRSKVVS